MKHFEKLLSANSTSIRILHFRIDHPYTDKIEVDALGPEIVCWKRNLIVTKN